MKRIDREALYYLVWSALSFPPKLDKKVLEKLGVGRSHEAVERLVNSVCDSVDNDRFAVIDRGDNWGVKREQLPARGDLVELRSLGPSVPPPPKREPPI